MTQPDDAGRLVVIDGPAGAGKTSVAQRVARALGLPLLDTGAIYRTLALVARRRGVSWDDAQSLAALAQGLPIRFGELPPPGQPQPVAWGDEDVTAAIRAPDISQGASKVSAHAPVRAALLEIQRELGRRGCVAEGRDMGTVVFPYARHKFFLTADLGTRARRRHAELVAKGGAVPSLAEVEREVAERDARDSERAAAPLKQADDAVLLDSSSLGVDAVVETILAAVRRGG